MQIHQLNTKFTMVPECSSSPPSHKVFELDAYDNKVKALIFVSLYTRSICLIKVSCYHKECYVEVWAGSARHGIGKNKIWHALINNVDIPFWQHIFWM